LAQMLGFPDYYGKNLDALYDLLTEQGEETLVWILHAGAMHPKLEQVFTDATADNEHFTALFMTEDEDDAAEDCGTEE
ncbi:MAG: barstar family protein, partial [Oscillospiraceae bacterium]|nr:barstar family protein [Oscillospiraceae bacterium]